MHICFISLVSPRLSLLRLCTSESMVWLLFHFCNQKWALNLMTPWMGISSALETFYNDLVFSMYNWRFFRLKFNIRLVTMTSTQALNFFSANLVKFFFVYQPMRNDTEFSVGLDLKSQSLNSNRTELSFGHSLRERESRGKKTTLLLLFE